jgi:homopolymeric O-antigen transport system permease protein
VTTDLQDRTCSAKPNSPGNDKLAADSPYHLCIRPRKGLVRLGLSDLWTFRELLRALVVRDIKLRYRQTALGVAWVILQPLLASGILAFVFGSVAKVTTPDRSPVFIFVLGGFIGWSLFSTTLSKSSQSLIQHSALITKVFFPRIILPASSALSALFDLVIGLALLIALAFISGISFGWQFILLPLWLCLLLTLASGLGLVSAALSVRFRDVQHIIPVVVQMLFFASPIAYRSAAVPGEWRGLFNLNPLSPIFDGLRWSLLMEGNFHPWETLYASVLSFLTLGFGLAFFRTAEREFSDLI